MNLKQHLKYLCISSILSLLLVSNLSANEENSQLIVDELEIQLRSEDATGNPTTPPMADFTYIVTPEKGPAPFTVSLDASNSSDDENGEIISYEWKSSDGQEASGEQVELIFSDEGEYTITLKVTDNDDLTAESTQILQLESWIPEFIYNSTARAYPQVIAAGVSPSKIDAFADSEFDVVALVRPGVLPIKQVSFERVEETQSLFGGLKRAMTLAGVLANGDEIYKFTYVFERGSIREFVLETTWGSNLGQFNIVAKDSAENRSHTFPYLMVGNYPIQKAKTKEEQAVDYNNTKRFGPQVIMAGYSPAILDFNDTSFDVIAVVRAGTLPIKHVILKQSQDGLFTDNMEPAGTLDNGDKIYKATFTYPRGALGSSETISFKDLWGPDATQFGVKVIDDAAQYSHKFPNVEFGNFPAMK